MRNTWIISPTIDTFLICGGLFWLLYGLHLLAQLQAHNANQLAFLANVSTMGTLYAAETHSISTLFLLKNGVKDNRNDCVLLQLTALLPWLALGVGLLICKFFLPQSIIDVHKNLVAGTLLKIYLLWIPQHFLAQARGIFQAYCLKAAIPISGTRRFWLFTATRVTMVYWMSVLLTNSDGKPEVFLGLELPIWSLFPLWLPILLQALAWICLLILLTFLGEFFSSNLFMASKDREAQAPIHSLIMLVSAMVIFLVPQNLLGDLWLYAPAYFHGAQYLGMVFARIKDSQPLLSCLFWPLSLIIALLIFGGLPLVVNLTGIGLPTATALVFATAQLQHIFLDSRVWKLRSLGHCFKK
jgi:hypothetical protein